MAIADAFVALSHHREGTVIRPFLPEITSEYAFVFPRWHDRSALLMQLVGFIREEAEKLLGEGFARG